MKIIKIILLSLLTNTCIIQAMDRPTPQISWGQWFKAKLGFRSQAEHATNKLMQLFAKMVTEQRERPNTFDPAPYISNIQSLLDLGANPNEVFGIETVYDLHNPLAATTHRITRGTGLSFLQWAQRLQTPQFSELLLSKGGILDLNDAQQKELLFNAVRTNRPNLVRILLEQGIDPNIQNSSGTSALWLAIFENNLNNLYIARLLLEYGTETNHFRKWIATPPYYSASYLEFAILTRNLDAIKLLLKHGANPNLLDPAGHTPLSIAVNNPHYDYVTKGIIQILLENGANPNIKDDNGQNALDIALKRGAPDSIIELLRNPPSTKKLGLEKLQ